MKKQCILLLMVFCHFGYSQTEKGSEVFWKNLEQYCGQAFEGEIISGASADDQFSGKTLIMHVKQCDSNQIKVPFMVGNDRSRTWVFTRKNSIITLKHDHRHADGKPDKITQYGGTSPNTGLADIQFFPADQETSNLIPRASTNVWWVTVDDTTFTYNLRRINSDKVFSVRFDTTTAVDTPEAPWGWDAE